MLQDKISLVVLYCSTTCLLGWSSSAWAQVRADSGQLEEVVVTAQKRATSAHCTARWVPD